LADLARELADAESHDGRLLMKAVATHEVGRAPEQKPGRHVAFAHAEKRIAGSEGPRRAAGEAPGRLDLQRLQNGKHLLAAGVDKGHALSPPRSGLAAP